MINLRYILGLCLLLLSVSGCDDSIASKEFDEGCWALNDSFRVEVEQANEEAIALELAVNFEDLYAYRNLHLQLVQQAPSGEVETLMLNDTFVNELGDWIEGETSASYAVTLPISETGTHQLKIVQYMRESPLCHIESIQLK